MGSWWEYLSYASHPHGDPTVFYGKNTGQNAAENAPKAGKIRDFCHKNCQKIAEKSPGLSSKLAQMPQVCYTIRTVETVDSANISVVAGSHEPDRSP